MNLKENFSLRKYNTFGIDASAKYFLEANSTDEVHEFLSENKFQNISRLILGGGSNLLLTKNVDGVVLKNSIGGIELLREDPEHYYVKAGGGVVWHEFVLYCIKNKYAGIENLSLIPGCVGAAPIQNIGAYGVEQKDTFHELEAIDLNGNMAVVFTHSDCKFSYRDSIFKREAKNKFIITSVTYRLNKIPKYNTSYGAINQEIERAGVKELSIAAISQAVCTIRRSKLPDPAVTGNAGSFFKNPTVSSEKYESLKKEFPLIVGYPSPAVVGNTRPDGQIVRGVRGEVKLAAGWLIEQCGWKGRSFGNYGVHKNQALVLVNYGGAKGNEIYELSEKVLRSVNEKFDVTLEREVVIL